MHQQLNTPSVRRVSLVVFLLMAITLVSALITGIENGVDPVSLLPENTTLLVDLKKPASSIIKLRRSPLGRQIASVEWQEVLQDGGMSEGDIHTFVNRTTSVEKVIKSAFFSELLGRRVLLGMIPVPVTRQLHDNEDKSTQEIVVIARPRHRASLVAFVSRFFVGEYVSAEQSYKGRIIKTYIFDNNLTVFSSVTNGLVIASFSPRAIELCIDVSIKNMTAGRLGLQGNTSYNQLRKRAAEKDDLFVYVNTATLRDIVLTEAGEDRYCLLDYPVRNAVFFRQPDKGLVKYSAIIQYNHDKVGQGASFSQRYQPVRDTILDQLPADILAHVWTNIFDVNAIWGLVQSRPYSFMRPYLRDFETWLLKNSAMTVTDFLSLFGHQASLNVTEIKSSDSFPIPRIYLWIRVNDQPKTAHLLKQLFAGLRVQESMVKNKKVFTIMLAGGLIQPSYMLSEGFLVLADSRQQLSGFLTENRKPLLSLPLFNKVDVGLAEKNNLVIFHRGTDLIDWLKELLLWYGSMLPPEWNNSGPGNRVIINTVLIPILENMKKYQAKSVRIYNTGSEIIMQSALLKQE